MLVTQGHSAQCIGVRILYYLPPLQNKVMMRTPISVSPSLGMKARNKFSPCREEASSLPLSRLRAGSFLKTGALATVP